MKLSLRSALAAALILSATTALGATRYVTDELRISVRTGQGNQFRIIEVIGSGTRVESLQTVGEWAEIRTPDGNTGWVRAQYLDEQPVAADRLRAARAELEQARERITELGSALETARAEAGSAQSRINDLTSRVEELQGRLADAEKGLDLHDENEFLGQRVKSLEQRVADMRKAASELEQRSRKEWFIIGAGVLFGGMLFGIIVTRIPWRRRRDRMF